MKLTRLCAVVALSSGLCGCAVSTPVAPQGPAPVSTPLSPAYYAQAIAGHVAMLRAARPIDEWIADPATPARLRDRLVLAQQIRNFASRELGLPNNGSYTRYADLERPFVVWNLFATPELSMQLKQWCFPVAGCVSYRGYYSKEAAEQEADQLRRQGLEVQLAGIPAYSTLGWFDDPLLNTFIFSPPAELARLVFHELAHQVVYLQNDTTFNESFATAVEEVAVERWLATQASEALRSGYADYAKRRGEFLGLLKRTRQVLEAIYADQSVDVQAKRLRKQAAFDALRADYASLKTQWGGFAGYDRWFAQPLTNAHFASIATYTELVPGFRRLLEEEGGDLPRFYARVRTLSRASAAERATVLGAALPTLPVRPQQ
jgi:predicted aminopeptidase